MTKPVSGGAVRLEREPVDFLEAFVEAQADWCLAHRTGSKRRPKLRIVKGTRTR